jgi:hypothetical protein
MLKSDAREIAISIFEGKKYEPSGEDIERLSTHILLLEERGLGNLNKRLIKSGRKIWDTFVEHNFASELASSLDPSAKISYEPAEKEPPPDLRIEICGLIYWIQVKNLSLLERENRQAKLLDDLRRFAEGVGIGKFFECQLSEGFTRDSLPVLQHFITTIAPICVEGQEYLYPNKESPKAKITFWLPQTAKLSHLTLGIAGDMDMVELTGLAREQIIESVLKTATTFKWDSDKKTINLVAMDVEKHSDIDVCDALFGTEFELSNGIRMTWSRERDGLYQDQDFSKKVVGVIGLRKKDKFTPISEYRKIFYMNEKFKEYIDNISQLFTFEKVVFRHMRPPIGKGNF